MSWFINHRPGATIERHSLSHALAGVPAPSEREPGRAAPLIVPPGNRKGCGRFSSPLRNSKEFTFYHPTDDSPSASLRSAAPSEREPGTVGLHHSPCRPETATLRAIFIAPTKLKSVYIPPFNRGRAIFIAPTETQKILHSTVWKEKRKKYGYFGTAQWD